MNKIIITAIAAAALALGAPAIASAEPDMCEGHVDQTDTSNGRHAGEKSIPGCEGESGPDYANNAQTPDAVPHPDAVPPLAPMGPVDTGTFDDNQFVVDEDGIQGHGNVRNSPIYVPGR